MDKIRILKVFIELIQILFTFRLTNGSESSIRGVARFFLWGILRKDKKELGNIKVMINILENKEPLSQVVFIHDYIQLIFQEYILSLYNPIEINIENKTISDGDAGFSDVLQNLIGKRIVKTNYKENSRASFEFSNKVIVSITLVSNSNFGLEAFQINDGNKIIVVEQNA